MNLTRSQAISRLFVKEVNEACIKEQAMSVDIGTVELARELNLALDKRAKLLEALHMLTINGCM